LTQVVAGRVPNRNEPSLQATVSSLQAEQQQLLASNSQAVNPAGQAMHRQAINRWHAPGEGTEPAVGQVLARRGICIVTRTAAVMTEIPLHFCSFHRVCSHHARPPPQGAGAVAAAARGAEDDGAGELRYAEDDGAGGAVRRLATAATPAARLAQRTAARLAEVELELEDEERAEVHDAVHLG
jgi:hypothetical protein